MYNNHNKDVWYLLKRGMLALYTLYTISMIYPLFQSSFKITINIQVQLTQKNVHLHSSMCTHVTRMALCRSVHLKQRGDKAENGKRHTHGASPLPHTQHKHWWKLCIYTKYHKRCVLCYLCTVSSLYINISPYSTSLNRACNK